jgi:exodeoxyribonuclease VII small subunit
LEQVTRQSSHLLLQQIYGHRAPEVALQSGSGAFPLAKFEDCLQRLEKIVQELEKGDAPLEKSLTLFEEGMQLSTACRKELEQAEGKVEILLKQNGKLQAVAFDSESEKISSRR